MKRENTRNSAKFSKFDASGSSSAQKPLHTLPRLFVAQDLEKDKVFLLDSNQSHYLVHVLRLKEGDSIRVFNGLHGDWGAALKMIKKQSVEIIVTKQNITQNHEPDICLYCAPIKRAHFEDIITKCTELGIHTIQPILTQRTQVRDVNINRIKDLAKEAAEQSERLSVPIIKEIQTLEWLLTQSNQDQILIYCAEHGQARPIAAALQEFIVSTIETKKKPSFGILVGPEGGFTNEEMDHLHKLSHGLAVRLGPRILRADTAAIAALSCWQAICGDWALDNDTRR